MTRYLLDTNVLSALMRDPRGLAADRVRAVGVKTVCTSVIVAGELRFGAARRNAPRLTAAVEAVLGSLDVMALEGPADRHYGALRAGLEGGGAALGANDMLIAAHAQAAGCVLVTDDRAFLRVPGLVVENWLV